MTTSTPFHHSSRKYVRRAVPVLLLLAAAVITVPWAVWLRRIQSQLDSAVATIRDTKGSIDFTDARLSTAESADIARFLALPTWLQGRDRRGAAGWLLATFEHDVEDAVILEAVLDGKLGTRVGSMALAVVWSRTSNWSEVRDLLDGGAEERIVALWSLPILHGAFLEHSIAVPALLANVDFSGSEIENVFGHVPDELAEQWRALLADFDGDDAVPHQRFLIRMTESWQTSCSRQLWDRYGHASTFAIELAGLDVDEEAALMAGTSRDELTRSVLEALRTAEARRLLAQSIVQMHDGWLEAPGG